MTADEVADFRRKVDMTKTITIAWTYLSTRFGRVSSISNVSKRMCCIRLKLAGVLYARTRSYHLNHDKEMPEFDLGTYRGRTRPLYGCLVTNIHFLS